MLRVMIADKHTILRKGVRHLIEGHVGWEVCGEAATGREALELARREKPNIAVVEVTLPLMDGVALAEGLREECPDTRVLFLTARDDSQAITAAMAAGARGYMLKTDSALDLEAAISALGANRLYFSTYVSELLLNVAVNGRERSGASSLTPRELDVIGLIADGKSNRQIGIVLGIAAKTVETHRMAAMGKAGVTRAGELVRFAIKHGLIQA